MRNFVGFWPMSQEKVEIEIGVSDIINSQCIGSDFEINVINLVFAELDIIVSDSVDAMFAKIDFVGEH